MKTTIKVLLMLVLLLSMMLTINAQEDLGVGDTVEGTATGNVTFSVSLEAGQSIVFEAMSDEFDAYLALSGPDGTQIATDDDSGEGLNSRMLVSVIEDGTYTLVLSAPFGGQANGAYTLSVDTLEVTPITVGESITIDPNDISTHYFSLAVEENTVVNLAGDSVQDTTLTLLLDNQQIDYDDDGGAEMNPALRRISLDEGIYLIAMDVLSGDVFTSPATLTVEQSQILKLGTAPVEITFGQDISNETLVFDVVAEQAYTLEILVDQPGISLNGNITQEDVFFFMNFSFSDATRMVLDFTPEGAEQAKLELSSFIFSDDEYVVTLTLVPVE